MKHIVAGLITLLLAAFFASAAEEPDQIRDRGLEALRASQTDEAKIVEAAQCLAEAAETYEKAGKADQAAELNSYLYWCKRHMTLQQAEEFAGKGAAGNRIAARLEAVATQKTDKAEASAWLERADAFALANEKDPFLCAMRYFEVADRFVGTQESRIAEQKMLDLVNQKQHTGFAGFADLEKALGAGAEAAARVAPAAKACGETAEAASEAASQAAGRAAEAFNAEVYAQNQRTTAVVKVALLVIGIAVVLLMLAYFGTRPKPGKRSHTSSPRR